MRRWLLIAALSNVLMILVCLFADLLGVHWMMGFGSIIGIAGVAPTLLFAWYGVLDTRVCFPSCSCANATQWGEG